MKLHILDTSNYIHIGDAASPKKINRGVRETNFEYQSNVAPFGGVYYLLNKVMKLHEDPSNIVVPVFDSTPTIKRKMYGDVFNNPYGYKAGRKSKGPSIGWQRDLAKKLLTQAGFPVQYVEGYEADDIIYTLVQMYKEDYEHIYIHTLDSDLAFLVDDNVSIAAVSDANPKIITKANYEYSITKKRRMVYNISHLVKLCYGDTSDNIFGIGEAWADAMDNSDMKLNYPKMGDLDYARKCLRQLIYDNPALPNVGRVLQTFDILVPLLIPYDELDDDIE